MRKIKAVVFITIMLLMCFSASYALADVSVSGVNCMSTEAQAFYGVTLTNNGDKSATPAVITVGYEDDVLKAVDIQKCTVNPGESNEVMSMIDMFVTDKTRITGFVLESMDSAVPVRVDTIEKIGSKDNRIVGAEIEGLSSDRIAIDEETKEIAIYLPFYDRMGNSVDYTSANVSLILGHEKAEAVLSDGSILFEGEGTRRSANLDITSGKCITVINEEGGNAVYTLRIHKQLKESFDDDTPIIAVSDEAVTNGMYLFRGIGDTASQMLYGLVAQASDEQYLDGISAGYTEEGKDGSGFFISKARHQGGSDTGILRFFTPRVDEKTSYQCMEFDVRYEYVGGADDVKNLQICGFEVRNAGSLLYRLSGSYSPENEYLTGARMPVFAYGENQKNLSFPDSKDSLLNWHHVKFEYFDEGNKVKLWIDGVLQESAGQLLTVKTPRDYSFCTSTKRCAKMILDNLTFTYALADTTPLSLMSVEDNGLTEATDGNSKNNFVFTPVISSEGEVNVSGVGNSGYAFTAVTSVQSADEKVNMNELSGDDFVAIDAVESETDGAFDFKWHLSDEAANGFYAFVGGNTGVLTPTGQRTVIIYHASEAEIERALLKINSASSENIADVLDDVKSELQISTILESEDYQKYKTDVADTMASIAKEGFESPEQVRETLKLTVGVYAVANSSAGNLPFALSVYSDVLGLSTEGYKSNQDAVQRCFGTVSREFRKSQVLTSDNIDELFDTAVALALINTSGREDIIAIIEENEHLFDIDTSKLSSSEKKAVAKKIAVSDIDDEYMTVDELKGAFKKAIDSLDDSTSSSAGGSKGGSKGGSGGFSSVAVSDGKTETKIVVDESVTKKEVKFTDLSLAPWAEEYIVSLCESGIVNGKSEKIFDPVSEVTREEFTKMLVMATNCTGKADVSFTDVDESEWYMPYIEAAFASGIINGYADGSFGIGRYLSREEAAVMIWRAAGFNSDSAEYEKSGFADADKISDFASASVDACVAHGIINGNENNEFLPQNNITRAECAKMIYCLIRTIR